MSSLPLATTLVHAGAMTIGLHAVRTFARHFAADYRLEIHTDGSVDEANQRLLLEAAEGMEVSIVTSADRRPEVMDRLAKYPKTRGLIERGAYFVKLEMPMVAKGPYFYFDSDIVWLRRAKNLTPSKKPNAFSTESWSWYYGVAQDRYWLKEKTPRRVNSGFYHIGQGFPYERMEDMMEKGMFDPTIPYNTDQEIMAYLFHEMEYYHPEDLKRTRVGVHYHLAEESCAALHFPGRMWIPHLEQIERLGLIGEREAVDIRYQDAVPLTRMELWRMRGSMTLATSPVLVKPLNLYRRLRQMMRGSRPAS